MARVLTKITIKKTGSAAVIYEAKGTPIPATLKFSSTAGEDLKVTDGTDFKQINIMLSDTAATKTAGFENGAKVDVEWKEDGQTNTAVGGTLKVDGTAPAVKYTISGLTLKGDFQFQFFGVIEIGDPALKGKTIDATLIADLKKKATAVASDPLKKAELDEKVKTAEEALENATTLQAEKDKKTALIAKGDALTPAQITELTKINLALAKDPTVAARISVNIGNMNGPKHWILDFSAKTNNGPGSYVNLTALIDWIKSTSGQQGEIKLPTEDGIPLKDGGNDFNPAAYIIEFKELWFNLTTGTFSIDIKSTEGSELTFGALTVKEVGFVVTNAASADDYKKLAGSSEKKEGE